MDWTLPFTARHACVVGIADRTFMPATGRRSARDRASGMAGVGSRFRHPHGRSVSTWVEHVLQIIQSEAGGRPNALKLFRWRPRRPRSQFAARWAIRQLDLSFTYAYHLDEAAYTNYLRSHALRLGARSGRRLGDGNVNADCDIILTLATAHCQRRYFIDCSGPAARMIGRISRGARRLERLAALRMAVVRARRPAPATAGNHPDVRSPAGWMWRAPLSQSAMLATFSAAVQDVAAGGAALQTSSPACHGGSGVHAIYFRPAPPFGSTTAFPSAPLRRLEPLVGADCIWRRSASPR